MTEDNHSSGMWMPDDRPEPEDCSLTPGCINCAGHLPPCTGKDGKRVYRAGEHPLESLQPKPRTTDYDVRDPGDVWCRPK
jgi:hypothetical protein